MTTAAMRLWAAVLCSAEEFLEEIIVDPITQHLSTYLIRLLPEQNLAVGLLLGLREKLPEEVGIVCCPINALQLRRLRRWWLSVFLVAVGGMSCFLFLLLRVLGLVRHSIKEESP